MNKLAVSLGGGLLIVGITAAVGWNWPGEPYALADAPKVDVTVRAEDSTYPDVQETAEDVDTLVRVYVQRLKDGDAQGIAHLAGPAYERPGPTAAKYVREYGRAAGGPVEVTVREGGRQLLQLGDGGVRGNRSAAGAAAGEGRRALVDRPRRRRPRGGHVATTTGVSAVGRHP
ncbi:hypothetical protein ACN6K9_006380 [Streptomyces sp. SAS_267]|uniref:hypothetical protein n=1 Tax=Streptomyces sp. SAS_267 TaxID=3412750 RepID=UPI00403C5309